jgi:RNA methyltransferase, TrmH family
VSGGLRVGANIVPPAGFKSGRVQQLRRLISDGDERNRRQQFVAEGFKLLQDGLSAGHRPTTVFAAAGDAFARAEALLAQTGQPSELDLVELGPGVIERVSGTVTPQGVISVFPQRNLDMINLRLPLMVLVDVRDPGNAGTILRSVEAAGLGGAIFTQGSVDPYHPKVVRASAGAIFNARFVRGVELRPLLAHLKSHFVLRIGTTMTAPQTYDQTDLTRDLAIFVGNEAQGLSVDALEEMDELVSIPIEGRSESLNVSMAASIIGFESARQRRTSPPASPADSSGPESSQPADISTKVKMQAKS